MEISPANLIKPQPPTEKPVKPFTCFTLGAFAGALALYAWREFQAARELAALSDLMPDPPAVETDVDATKLAAAVQELKRQMAEAGSAGGSVTYHVMKDDHPEARSQDDPLHG